ncbi:TetR/AcrR family transcriptional regulator [Falsiroseomonas tokyonensis]|uniref:TetR/AcrR family transcriptional regulator n=1 Tax=Falsiroseomonas tokyonensis TaxID=430521 RepID=A0ABV7BWK8_9PROT|nr:TetR/AcrR family transcriptional regulator [Falsiroseomonas tokyonensis]MBU8539664.1 TetR family transcriptional regulator [Falsiroseomonas tokyonensis]
MSTSTREAAQRRGATAEETRRRIEDMAETLFRTIGYQKTTVADIARELGMSPANIYRFYPSKSAINEVIAARMLDGVEAELWAIARGRGTATERLRTLLETLHHRHMALFFTQRRLHDMVTAAMAEHWGVVERFIEGIRTAIRHVLMDGAASGEFARLDADATATAIKMATIGFMHPVLIAECGLRDEPEEEMAGKLGLVIELLLRGLRP